MRFWLIFIVLLPVTAVQAIWLRRNAPRMQAMLSNAQAGKAGHTNQPNRLRLTVVGESTAVGVGCDEPTQSIALQLAEALTRDGRRQVAWQVIGANGARAEDVAGMLKTRASQPIDSDHMALVLLGVNDVTALQSARHWREQLVAIRGLLRARGVGRIFLAPVPPIGQFTLLPQPLRFLLGLRARTLEAERLTLPATFPDVVALQTEFPDRPELLAADGFHPGPAACSLWAEMLGEQMLASRSTQP